MKESWYETPGSLGLSFELNQSLTFPSLSQLDGARSFQDRPYSDVALFSDFAGKHRRGQLVRWVEKASLERIRWLLKITEVERITSSSCQ